MPLISRQKLEVSQSLPGGLRYWAEGAVWGLGDSHQLVTRII